MARRIIYDGREFPDPDPKLSVDEVRQHLAAFFPELSNAETKQRKEGEDSIVEFKRRVGTKGAGTKIRVRVIFPNRAVKEWFLTTENDRPVLIDEEGNTYGPAGVPEGTVIRVQSKHLLYAEGARLAGYKVED